MASKRNLYRPTGQNSRATDQKQHRKTLAQGRVVQDGTCYSQKSGNTKDIPSDQSSARDITPQKTRLFRESGDIKFPRTSGTRNSPQISEHKVVNSSQRTVCLDLSDSDGEAEKNSLVQPKYPVMTIDATRHIKDADSSEVEVIINYKDSPAKVICHSPRDGANSSRNVSEVSNLRIEVDHVPSKFCDPVANILGMSIHDKLDTFPEYGPMYGEDNFPKLEPGWKEPETGKLTLNFPQPDFDKPEMVPKVIVTDSESDVCSLHEYVRQKSKTKTDTAKTSKKSPDKTPGSVKKKKKGRIVPSRYMQMASASSTSMIDKNASKNKSSIKKELKYVSKKDEKPPLPTQRKAEKFKSVPPERPQTPESVAAPITKTSTPTMDISFFPHGIDESAIHAETSALSAAYGCYVSSAKKTKSFTRDPQLSMLSNISNVSSIQNVSKKPAKKTSNKKTQQDLDLMYGLYVQWSYVASKMKKARIEQEKKAMQQLHGLWEDNERIREKNFLVEQELSSLKHKKRVDHQLEIQEAGLEPVMKNLDKFELDYSSLALAIDSTRHQISTKGIYIPKDEEEYQEQLITELEEIEDKLRSIEIQTEDCEETLSAFANCLETLEKAVADECEGIRRGVEYIAASKTLLTHENSLKIGLIENQV